MKSKIAAGALVLGLALFVLSLFWVWLFPGTSSWTPEKAELWAKTKDRLHNLSFIVNSPPGSVPIREHRSMAEAEAEYKKVKAMATKLRAEFESAYNTPRTTATVLKWTGLSLMGVGVVGWLATRDAAY